MALKDRNKKLALVAELLRVHLPVVLAAGDEALGRDLLCAIAFALRAVRADVDNSADAWDKRAYHVKADALRREWRWIEYARDYAEGLAKSANTLESRHIERLSWLIPDSVTPAARAQIADVETLRGSCTASRKPRKRQPAGNTARSPD